MLIANNIYWIVIFKIYLCYSLATHNIVTLTCTRVHWPKHKTCIVLFMTSLLDYRFSKGTQLNIIKFNDTGKDHWTKGFYLWPPSKVNYVEKALLYESSSNNTFAKWFDYWTINFQLSTILLHKAYSYDSALTR